jgi:predicted secreted protein
MSYQFTSSTYFRVGALATGTTKPTEKTLTVTSAAIVGATSLTVAATTGFISSGSKFTIGGATFTVAEDAPRGSTELVLATPLTAPITANATTKYYELFEFLGGEGIDLNGQDQVINVRNFKSGQWGANVKIMTGVSCDLEGQFLTEDLAITAIIRPAYFTLGGDIYAEITRDNGDKWMGAFLVSNYSESAALDNILRVRYSLQSQGAVAIPAPPILT